MVRFHLISLCPSHYCEKARWALQRSTPFTEAAHFPAFHLLFVKKLGGGTSLPKLIITNNNKDIQVLHDSADILAYTDTVIPSEQFRLYPEDKKEEINQWENVFNNVLGPHIRRWAYCHLLFRKGIYPVLSYGAPFYEKIAGFILLPVLRRAIYKFVGCGKENAKEISFRKIAETFKKVDEALSDGREFICGHRFTAADLTFASLAAPAVLPKGHGSLLPTMEQCPAEMVEQVKQLRDSPAGKHVLKMYETQRYKSAI